MKQIIKKEPVFFTNFLKKKKPKNWSEVSTAIGEDIRIYMLSGLTPNEEAENLPSEQNHQCAYTELYIDSDGQKSHIDHFWKRGLFPKKYLEWENLFTAHKSGYFGANYKDNNIKEADYKWLINPAVENPNDFLTYTLTGEILEKNKEGEAFKKAKMTIERFNLNEKQLVNRRRGAVEMIKAYVEQLPLEKIKQEIGELDSFVDFAYDALKNVALE